MEDHCETKKEEQFQCVLCAYVSGYRHNMRRHLKTVHRSSDPKSFGCVKCGQKFSHLEIMQWHIQKDCRSENSKKSLISKMKIVNVEKKANDNSSQGTFIFAKEKNTKKGLGNQSNEIFTCSTCGEVFDYITEFRPHVMKCQKANALTAGRKTIFPNASTNQRDSIATKPNHIKNPKSKKMMERQDKERIIPCFICNYKSKYSWVLRKHMATKHNISNAKIHKCKFCEEMFADGHELAHHMGENYCTNTNKEFAKRRQLSVKQRRYNCSHCSYKAAYSHSIRIHLKRRHDQYSATFHTCKICNEVFMGFQHLKNHHCQPSDPPKQTKIEKQPKKAIHSFDDNPEIQVVETIRSTTIENGSSGLQSENANYDYLYSVSDYFGDSHDFEIEETEPYTATEIGSSELQSENPKDIEYSIPSAVQPNLNDSETVIEELCDPFFSPDEIYKFEEGEMSHIANGIASSSELPKIFPVIDLEEEYSLYNVPDHSDDFSLPQHDNNGMQHGRDCSSTLIFEEEIIQID